jgi:glycosyltransferase involved in cell wall biosynthesis
MMGHHPNHATSQAYILSELFRAAGYQTIAVSKSLNRYARLADISTTLFRQKGDIDIALIEVYSGKAFVVADVASVISRGMGYKVILTLHGGNLPSFIKRFPNWTRRVLSRADVLVAPSEYLARAVATSARTASIIPNVIDLGDYSYRSRARVRPRLFWMRSFHQLYNPALALRVAAGLRAEYPDVTLVMAGQDKGSEIKMRSLARDLGISDVVRFPGFLDKSGKAREGNDADIYLNTSRIDNVPVAILEAGAMGLPVVATRVGGLPYLLRDGDNGLLVPDNDPTAMIAAVKRLLNEPKLAERLSTNGRALAERAAWPRVQPLWEGLLQEGPR